MRKITFWLTLLLIFTIPWEDSLSLSIGTGTSITRLFGLGVAGCWFITILMEGRFEKLTAFHGLMALFFIWNIISYWWTIDLTWTYGRVMTYAQIFILMLIVWEMLRKPDELMAGLQAYVLGAFILIASTLINYLHGTVAVSYEGRYSATGVNAVDLELFLVLGMPLAWHLLTRASSKFRYLKIVNLLYLPLSIFAVLLTASRTSLFTMIPAFIYIVWPKKIDAGRIVLMAILLLVALVILQAMLPASVIERLSSVTSSIQDADLGGRVSLWAAAIEVFTQHPILGAGSGTMSTLIGAFAHQTFISVLAETGMVGLILFLSVILYVLNSIFRLPKDFFRLWLSTFFVWVIGVMTLSFEFRKITWLFFSFMILQGYTLRKQWQTKPDDIQISESEEVSALGLTQQHHTLPSLMGDDRGKA